MKLSYFDIELILTLFFLAICLLCGVKRRPHPVRASSFSLLAIDKSWSIVIKGISCVFVLMGHWCAMWMESESVLCKGIYLTLANYALCWFMFFSGYGLSIKEIDREKIGVEWLQRVKKIYAPLLLVCIITFLFSVVLPDKGLDENWPWFPEDVHILHNLCSTNFLAPIMHTFGLCDWYVWCILIFYSIFYVTLYFSNKFKVNHTLLLAMFMMSYNIIAYFVFGWEKAHYFRFPWIFMLGHIVAVYNKNPNYINVSVLIAFSVVMLIHLHEWVMFLNFFISVIGLLLFAIISRRYSYEGKVLLFLGNISYLFYLSHMRIGYPLLCYTGIRSMLLWIMITVAFSYGLHKFIQNTNVVPQ